MAKQIIESLSQVTSKTTKAEIIAYAKQCEEAKDVLIDDYNNARKELAELQAELSAVNASFANAHSKNIEAQRQPFHKELLMSIRDLQMPGTVSRIGSLKLARTIIPADKRGFMPLFTLETDMLELSSIAVKHSLCTDEFVRRLISLTVQAVR